MSKIKKNSQALPGEDGYEEDGPVIGEFGQNP